MFWGRVEAGKKKNIWAGRMWFWFIPKQLQQPHPQLVHCRLLVHSSHTFTFLSESGDMKHKKC
jgi:hypothetical protein